MNFLRWMLALFLALIGIGVYSDVGFLGSLICFGPAYLLIPKSHRKPVNNPVNTPQFTQSQPIRRATPTETITITLDTLGIPEIGRENPYVPLTAPVPNRGYSSKPQPKSNALWILHGETIVVAGLAINSGNVYVGEHLSANPVINDKNLDNHGWSINYPNDPALINPSLPVAKSAPDKAGQNLGYYPSYSEISAECRLAYLQWLSDGKSAPDAAIGYVFLYFYGLERRIIIDNPSKDELIILQDEINRLRGIYSANRSFEGYSQRLLEAVTFITTFQNMTKVDEIGPVLDGSADLRMMQLIGLANQLQKQTPLSFEWTMVAYFYVANGLSRIAAQRVRPTFLKLMRKRFEKKWPQGLKLRHRKGRFSFLYQGANRYIRQDLAKSLNTFMLPDPLLYDWAKITEIGGQAENELAQFARAVGRQPEIANSPEAISLLPKEISQDSIKDLLASHATWLEKIAAPIGQAKVSDLIDRFLSRNSGIIDQKKLKSIAQVLELLGYGIEPDPDFSKTKLKSLDTAILFDARSFKEIRGQASQGFTSALLFVALIAGISAASETGLGDEERKWLGWIRKTFNLSEVEYRRLEAHLEWLYLQKITIAQIKKMVAAIPASQRDTLAQFAAAIAAADGVIEKSEVAFLEKFYDELQVDRKNLYATLHSLAAESTKSQAIMSLNGAEDKSSRTRKKKLDAVGISDPNLPQQLDEAKIKTIIRETKQVSIVLTGIFGEDDKTAPVPPEAMVSTHSNDPRFSGLDASYAALTAQLLAQGTWERSAFEAIAKKAGVLPDGALEAINEWAYDQFGEALIEDGSTLKVNLELVG